jgi:hypothetical protein
MLWALSLWALSSSTDKEQPEQCCQHSSLDSDGLFKTELTELSGWKNSGASRQIVSGSFSWGCRELFIRCCALSLPLLFQTNLQLIVSPLICWSSGLPEHTIRGPQPNSGFVILATIPAGGMVKAPLRTSLQVVGLIFLFPLFPSCICAGPSSRWRFCTWWHFYRRWGAPPQFMLRLRRCLGGGHQRGGPLEKPDAAVVCRCCEMGRACLLIAEAMSTVVVVVAIAVDNAWVGDDGSRLPVGRCSWLFWRSSWGCCGRSSSL